MPSPDETFDRFQAPQAAMDAAILRMKEHGNVAPNASFNPDAKDGLRTEVAYHDEDFLWFLANPGPDLEVAIVDSAIAHLVDRGLVSRGTTVDHDRFQTWRATVKPAFSGSWTSFTPVMERLFYALTQVRRPGRLVEFGCFWGNTLAWFAGPALGADRAYRAESIIGVDIEGEMIDRARANFESIGAGGDVELVAADARVIAPSMTEPIDFLYLEAKEEGEPSIYLELLEAVYDLLPDGAWVIAHDIYDKDAIPELHDYLAWVRDPSHFSASIAIDVDDCGAELSVK
jgi:predicted O-methyltransferase YrrM